MDGTSLKADLLRKRRRATLTAQREEPPYQYVMVEGPVTVNYENFDIAELSIRYLGPEVGASYAKKSAQLGFSRSSTSARTVAHCRLRQNDMTVASSKRVRPSRVATRG